MALLPHVEALSGVAVAKAAPASAEPASGFRGIRPQHLLLPSCPQSRYEFVEAGAGAPALADAKLVEAGLTAQVGGSMNSGGI